jgi:hypothetical protein
MQFIDLNYLMMRVEVFLKIKLQLFTNSHPVRDILPNHIIRNWLQSQVWIFRMKATAGKELHFLLIDFCIPHMTY